MTPSTTRLLAKTTSKLSAAAAASLRPSPNHQKSIRAFSQTCRRQADEPPPASRQSLISRLVEMQSQSAPPQTPGTNTTQNNNSMSDISRVLATNTLSRAMNSDSILGDAGAEVESYGPAHEPFHFHIFSHKHNCHITVTRPDRNAIVSMSAGQIGFKKSKRGTYDAAYQLCAFVLDKLNQGGWHRKITALEVVLRGFGPGREAATKVLLGSEGRLLRPHIKKVSDSTRLKFGGTRSPRPKRLG